MPDLAYYENLREQLVEQEYDRLLNEALNDITAFEKLDADYEICLINSGQIQRALRNLKEAVAGKHHAQEAVFIALGYVANSLKSALAEQSDASVKSVEEMQFDERRAA